MTDSNLRREFFSSYSSFSCHNGRSIYFITTTRFRPWTTGRRMGIRPRCPTLNVTIQVSRFQCNKHDFEVNCTSATIWHSTPLAIFCSNSHITNGIPFRYIALCLLKLTYILPSSTSNCISLANTCYVSVLLPILGH